MPDKNTPCLLLSWLLRVMGDDEPDTVIFLTDEDGRCAQKRPTTSSDAKAAYGDAQVLRVWPYIHSDGEMAGNVYVLKSGTLKKASAIPGGYALNPYELCVNANTWRLGDDACIIDKETGDTIKGRIASIAGPGGPEGPRASLTVTSGGSKTSVVAPVECLFRTSGDARKTLAMRSYPKPEPFLLTADMDDGQLWVDAHDGNPPRKYPARTPGQLAKSWAKLLAETQETKGKGEDD